jgi:hypothetical protein
MVIFRLRITRHSKLTVIRGHLFIIENLILAITPDYNEPDECSITWNVDYI